MPALSAGLLQGDRREVSLNPAAFTWSGAFWYSGHTEDQTLLSCSINIIDKAAHRPFTNTTTLNSSYYLWMCIYVILSIISLVYVTAKFWKLFIFGSDVFVVSTLKPEKVEFCFGPLFISTHWVISTMPMTPLSLSHTHARTHTVAHTLIKWPNLRDKTY